MSLTIHAGGLKAYPAALLDAADRAGLAEHRAAILALLREPAEVVA